MGDGQKGLAIAAALGLAFLISKRVGAAPPLSPPGPTLTGTSNDLFDKNGRRLAYPGAVGPGAYSLGGAGGPAIFVDNLDDFGSGSLKEALRVVSGPRNVIPRVGGILNVLRRIEIRNPYITLAAHLAPGHLTLRGTASGSDQILWIRTHNVVIRYLRSRCSGHGTPGHGQIAFNIFQEETRTPEVHDVILDHCSGSWTLDENFRVRRNDPLIPQPLERISINHCIMSESLDAHSTGLLVAGKGGTDAYLQIKDVEAYRCLFHTIRYRQPLVEAASFRAVNCLISNWTAGRVDGTRQSSTADWISCLYLPGPATDVQSILDGRDFLLTQWIQRRDDLATLAPSIYVKDLLAPGIGTDWDLWAILDQRVDPALRGFPIPLEWRRDTPLPIPEAAPTVVPTAQLKDILLDDVGANAFLDASGQFVPNLDPIDARVIGEVRQGTGRSGGVAHIGQVGGFDGLDPGPIISTEADSNGDGIPDVLAEAWGFSATERIWDIKDNNGVTLLDCRVAGVRPVR